jgi:hypothetical protein
VQSLGPRKTAGSFRKFLLQEEPDFVHKIDAHLRLPYLVFYERKIYGFDGHMKGNRIFYKTPYFLGLNREFNPYLERLAKANELLLEGNNVILLKNGQKRDVIQYDAQKAGQETPFLLQFEG